MKSKFLLSIIVAVAFSTAIFAKDVLRNQAEKVAVNFFFEKTYAFNQGVDYHNISIIDSYKVDNAYFVVNFEDGWVVVSANDATLPVLGYNTTGSYPSEDRQDYNYKSWMQHFVDQANYIKENDIQATEETLQAWERYSTDKPDLSFMAVRDVTTPLLSSTWNQDDPYNVLCPEDEAGPGGHVYVGCVATAMSMIMHYWRYPNSGSGSYQYYQYPYGIISADFENAEYEWDGMQDNINNNNPWEMAEIGFHAAVSVQMNFGPNGSGSYSWNVPSALIDHFNYSSSAQYIEKSNYSTASWENILQGQLDIGQPLYYSGFSTSGGHAFGCDGYDGMNYYHFNFGWSGSGNGFYTLQDVNGYNSGQGAVRNIIPGDNNYPYMAAGADTLTFRSGSFCDGSGPVEDYTSGIDASWLISPQTEMDSIESISLSFVDFETNASDHLKVYAGNDTTGELLGDFSGSDIPGTINFDGNEIFITFTSTGSAAGFKAEYTSSAPTWCSGSQTFTEPSGSFSDGSGDFYYNNSTTCVYVIQNPEAVRITLEFTDFATELDKDKVKVFNGSNQLIADFSGDELPEPVVEETNAMFITWSTNNSVRDLGWSAEYYIDGVGVEENIGDYNNVSVYPNPSNGTLNVNFNVENAGNLDVKLINLNGQIIMQQTINNFDGEFNQSFDLSKQPKGIYLLSINSEKGIVSRKVVLQ